MSEHLYRACEYFTNVFYIIFIHNRPWRLFLADMKCRYVANWTIDTHCESEILSYHQFLAYYSYLARRTRKAQLALYLSRVYYNGMQGE
jgi:hypothetical protein